MSIDATEKVQGADLLRGVGRSGDNQPPRARRSMRVAMDVMGTVEILAVIAGAIAATALMASWTDGKVQWSRVLQAALLCAAIVHIMLRGRGDYRMVDGFARPFQPLALVLVLTLSSVALYGIGAPFALDDARVWFWYALWIACSFVLIAGTRYAGQSWIARHREGGAFDCRVAVYGGGRVAARLVEHARTGTSGITLVGIFDDRVGGDRAMRNGPPIDGSLKDLIEVGRRELVDQVIIALPPSADQRLASIACKLEQLPVSLHVCSYIASDVYDYAGEHRVSALGPVGLIDIKKKPLADWGPIVKAAEDRVIGTLMLVALLPVLAVVAVAVKLDSRGPVLFRQRRHGLNHRVITVNKFRTMRVLEDGDVVRQATRNDKRVTRIGAFLRRTSLDELPQLFNVVKGEMSLVGPRPHALVHDEQWGELLERYANRFQVKPGITGWAQVNGYRGEIETTDDMQHRVEYDLSYINEWSLGFDLRILWRTLFVAFTDRKAY